MRRSYTAFLSLYILFLLFLFFLKVYKSTAWQDSHDVTPRKEIEPPSVTQSETQIEFHNVTPENHTEIHNGTLPNQIEFPKVTPQNRIKKALVVVTKAKEDCTWMNDVDPSWTKYTYLVTEDSLPTHSNFTLSVPMNKANEAMRYLSFFIDNYNDLPEIIAFRHGHRSSWHQSADAAAEVNQLNLTTIRERGYQNFRCTVFDGTYDHDCPADGKDHLTHNGKPYWESVEPALQNAFTNLWNDWFGSPRPEYLMSPCCAQFVVTREAVLGRSKDEYVKYRQFLIDTELDDYFSGRVFERSWHVIFGKPPVLCETEEECKCQVYTGSLGCNDWRKS